MTLSSVSEQGGFHIPPSAWCRALASGIALTDIKVGDCPAQSVELIHKCWAQEPRDKPKNAEFCCRRASGA